MTLRRQEKIGNIFFLKQNTFFYKKMYVWHFYPKIPTGLHSSLHYLIIITNTVFFVGEELLVLVVGKITGENEPLRPNVKYVGNMHGNEVGIVIWYHTYKP